VLCAVTGLKYNGETEQYGVLVKDKSGEPTGQMRQFGDNSDFDFAIVDKDLLRDIKMHPGLRGVAGVRSDRSFGIELDKLDRVKLDDQSTLWRLRETLREFRNLTGRKHSIMVYRSDADIEKRRPHMWLGQ
tara:strand:- start:1863 stop:2255 length:393 start_codon:yes stop_codon:yes gene_type:complete